MAKQKRAPARRGRATRTLDRPPRTTRATRSSRAVTQQAEQQLPSGQQIGNTASIRRQAGVAIEHTSEAAENARHRFEETDEPASSFAASRDLSPAAKLPAQVELLNGEPVRSTERALLAGCQPEETAHRPEPSLVSDMQPAQDESTLAIAEEKVAPFDASTIIERLHRAVLEELSAVETMLPELKREPQNPLDAERTARTLSNLTEILQKLQRLQCALPETGSSDDDMPVDIDEFRRELARRIDEFVASRTDA